MTAILHLCAKNDYNGNPQRAYVLIDEDGPVAVWDEGYYGSDAVPGDFRKMAYDAERQEISVRKYKKLFKELPSPDYAYQVKGYDHLKQCHKGDPRSPIRPLQLTSKPPKSMSIHTKINESFYHLSQINAMIYDYWISELYDEEGNIVWEMWNEETVKLMEEDVLIGKSQLSLY